MAGSSRRKPKRVARDASPRADSRSLTLRLRRRVRASAQRAFDACATPSELSRWFTTRARGRARPGGRYSNGDGDAGRWLVVERPARLAFTWENPKHCPGTTVELAFEADARGSVVRLRHEQLASEADRSAMREGWSWALDSLRSYLETGSPIRHEDWLAGRASRRAGKG